jgi:hypothetical protein
VEPGVEIGMEACGGAHHWARLLQSKGYRVRLIAPQFVKPYVESNKPDANDAQAVCGAMSRPSMRYVAVKTIEQQDIQAVQSSTCQSGQRAGREGEPVARFSVRVRFGGTAGDWRAAPGGSGVAGRCVQWADRAFASAAFRAIRGSAGAR